MKMAVDDTIQFLKANKGKWFSFVEIMDKLKLSETSARSSLRKAWEWEQKFDKSIEKSQALTQGKKGFRIYYRWN